ncbi:2-amino-4-hydroxy-6-hydroxymethyldihydropteridine diphosphokinase [Nitrococcus mobilis]|uniref:2-amino-4-hydroxy-6-hydroxymethyldihydropteridine diphosphokinase n=1 Tax=Nitrococcus mobilis Nb-231 TaxID=314278 RepID=A4BN49_9GAMM|nr:2-amino-4-hydroxy-6-hydroxymethyldihydropteridine diphosphokinase [Nitrococcus mobilis]EAR22648.1 2-amino-4-hydroxy-6-hydroxymethyldihydropteridine pyrophosphokinase [Nitrococcus mobilis Nb-231]
MKRAYVSIGSNIDRETNVRSAIAQLRRRYGRLIISPIYESEAVGFVGAAFYNGVIGLCTNADALTLNAELRAIERAHGRRRNAAKFCSRSLDLDLLTWGDAVMQHPELILPRPEILEQAYVLRPLADIAGDVRHPLDGQTLHALWLQLKPSAQAMRVVELALD